MNICRFLWTTIFRIFGRTCTFYSVFGLSSSPNLFIEPRKNLKGSWVRWCEMFAKNSQNFERYAFMVYVCQKKRKVAEICINRINFLLRYHFVEWKKNEYANANHFTWNSGGENLRREERFNRYSFWPSGTWNKLIGTWSIYMWGCKFIWGIICKVGSRL